MRLLSTAAAVLIAAATLGADAARAQDCQSLWVERNSYYKNAGYCFRTQRAIQYFGNGGCYVTDERQLQFPPGVWARILQIRQIERAMGCPI
jgi:hypothetical protein